MGIEYVGFCRAERDGELFEILKKRRELFGINPFEESELEKRVNPACVLNGAKSVVVCLFPYYLKERENSGFAMYASVKDYHIVAREKLNLLAKELDGFEYVVCCDTDPLCDRYLAYKAGLGFFGKSSMLINEKYGTYFAIGFIVTNAYIEEDKPLLKTCGNCKECIKACPGGAIKEGYGFDYKSCFSYITQAKELSFSQAGMLKKSGKIVGCDVCQSACPYNKNAQETPIEDFKTEKPDEDDINLIKNMSNREFKEKYGKFAFSWIGKKTVARNIEEKNGESTKNSGKLGKNVIK